MTSRRQVFSDDENASVRQSRSYSADASASRPRNVSSGTNLKEWNKAGAHTRGPEGEGEESSRGRTRQWPLESTSDQQEADIKPPDESIRKPSYYPRSRSSVALSRVPDNTGPNVSNGSTLPDFFAPEIFQFVLHNPTTAHALVKFSQSALCGENMEFLERVEGYHALLDKVAKTMSEIHRDFVSPDAPNQINIEETIRTKVDEDLKTSFTSALPKLESLFLNPQADIEKLVFHDIYPRFVRHQITMSAAKALAGDRSKYAGLGDCFLLTDPSRADNPIVFASDGFSKVTGYSHKEIIPRNCRFLQSQRTDRSAVSRLRDAIDKREEFVELLLNEKKNGDPFWNLLYTTPLFNAHGNVVFFLGGQINCSTTIHNASDIMRIFSSSSDTDDAPPNSMVLPTTSQSQPAGGSRLMSAFRSSSKPTVQVHPPGMEQATLEKMEKTNLEKQMHVFYTAYSRVSPLFIAAHVLCLSVISTITV